MPTPSEHKGFERLSRVTADGTQANIAALAQLFPEAVTEGVDEYGQVTRGVNFEALQQLLSDHLLEAGKERYELTWPGKQQAKFTAHQPIAKTLLPNRAESVDFDTTQNLFIEGDNLDALKILRSSYLGKVKLIYIDPPYNTGGDLIYKDKFYSSQTEYLKKTMEMDKEGNILVANPSSNGRFHSDWLSMIYPRLKIAKSLLTSDGTLAISIDDNELHNLIKICEELFNVREIKIITVKMSEASGVKMASVNNNGTIPKLKEHIVLIKLGGIRGVHFDPIQKTEWDDEYSTFLDGVSHREITNLKRSLEGSISPDSSEIKQILSKINFVSVAKKIKELGIAPEQVREFKIENSWRIVQFVSVTPSLFEKIKIEKSKYIDQPAFIYKSKDATYLVKTDYGSGSRKPRCQIIFAEDNLNTHPGDFWSDIRTTGINSEGEINFKNGKKPLKLIKRILKTVPNDSIILDFFAGSATTAHATMLLNQEDHGTRKYIMVQLPEEISENEKTNNLIKFDNIAQLSRERIRRAAAKIREEAPLTAETMDLGFRALTVADTNFVDNFAAAGDLSQDDLLSQLTSIKPGRTGEDVLFQTLLSLGLPLDLDIEQINISGTDAYSVAGGYLLACFSPTLTDNTIQNLATYAQNYQAENNTPVEHLVLLDSSFETDAARINAEQIFTQLSPETKLRVI